MVSLGHAYIDAGNVHSLSFAVAQQSAAIAALVAACSAAPARLTAPIVCPCGTWHWAAPPAAPSSSAWCPPCPPAFGQAPSAAASPKSEGQECMPRDAVEVVAAMPPASESEASTGSVTRLAFRAPFQAAVRGVPTYNRFSPLAELGGQETDVEAPPSCAFEGAARGSGEAGVFFFGGGAKLGTAAIPRSRHDSCAPRPLPSPVAPQPRPPSCVQKGGYATWSCGSDAADGSSAELGGQEAGDVAPPVCACDGVAMGCGVAEVYLGGGAKLGTAATSRCRHASCATCPTPSPVVPTPRSPSYVQKGGYASRPSATVTDGGTARPADAVTSNTAIGAAADATSSPRAAAADTLPASATSAGSGQSRFTEMPGSGEIGRTVQPRPQLLASDWEPPGGHGAHRRAR